MIVNILYSFYELFRDAMVYAFKTEHSVTTSTDNALPQYC